MSRRRHPEPAMHTDVVEAAYRYAQLLANRHGDQFPAFYDLLPRVRDRLGQLLKRDELAERADFETSTFIQDEDGYVVGRSRAK